MNSRSRDHARRANTGHSSTQFWTEANPYMRTM